MHEISAIILSTENLLAYETLQSSGILIDMGGVGRLRLRYAVANSGEARGWPPRPVRADEASAAVGPACAALHRYVEPIGGFIIPCMTDIYVHI